MLLSMFVTCSSLIEALLVYDVTSSYYVAWDAEGIHEAGQYVERARSTMSKFVSKAQGHVPTPAALPVVVGVVAGALSDLTPATHVLLVQGCGRSPDVRSVEQWTAFARVLASSPSVSGLAVLHRATFKPNELLGLNGWQQCGSTVYCVRRKLCTSVFKVDRTSSSAAPSPVLGPLALLRAPVYPSAGSSGPTEGLVEIISSDDEGTDVPALPKWFVDAQNLASSCSQKEGSSLEQRAGDEEVWDAFMPRVQELFAKERQANAYLTLSIINSLPMYSSTWVRLLETEWLNDELINGAGFLIEQAAQAAGRKVRVLGSFMLEKLCLGHRSQQFAFGDAHVNLWGRKQQDCRVLLQSDRILMPAHVGNNHWVAVMVDVAERRLTYWDSLMRASEKRAELGKLVLDQVARWAACQIVLELGYPAAAADIRASASSWAKVVVPATSSSAEQLCCPQQDNTVDCGVFTVAVIAHFAAGQNDTPKHTQSSIRLQRRRMLTQLLSQEWTGM
jgi:hypothetical protein